MKTNSLPALALAFTLAALSSSALAVDYVQIKIDPPASPNGEHGAVVPGVGKNDGASGPADPGDIVMDRDHNDWTDFDPTLIGKLGPIEPGPAKPKTPGGTLAVDGTPPIVILDDGVGSPGKPGPIAQGGDIPDGAVVIRLACSFSPDGLVIRNVGELDAPLGLKLKWRAERLGLGGTVRLDQSLRAGHSALLGGVAAEGTGCGLRLVS